MPYSKTPAIQTYETKRVNFISNPQQRSSDATKDFRLLNMMVEVIKTIQAFFINADLKMYHAESNRHAVPRAWNLSDDLGKTLSTIYYTVH